MKERINTRWGDARRAGTTTPTLFVGDTVRIVRGEEVGRVVGVMDVIGHAYSADNRIVVRSQDGELVFYLPWDVELVERRKGPIR